MLNQLLVLANMESYNAILIEQGKSQLERLIALRDFAREVPGSGLYRADGRCTAHTGVGR